MFVLIGEIRKKVMGMIREEKLEVFDINMDEIFFISDTKHKIIMVLEHAITIISFAYYSDIEWSEKGYAEYIEEERDVIGKCIKNNREAFEAGIHEGSCIAQPQGCGSCGYYENLEYYIKLFPTLLRYNDVKTYDYDHFMKKNIYEKYISFMGYRHTEAAHMSDEQCSEYEIQLNYLIDVMNKHNLFYNYNKYVLRKD